MNGYLLSHPSTTLLFHAGSVLLDAARALRRLAVRLDAEIASRKRAAQDRYQLNEMSERDLRDIGVSRSSIDAIANNVWTRDYLR